MFIIKCFSLFMLMLLSCAGYIMAIDTASVAQTIASVGASNNSVEAIKAAVDCRSEIVSAAKKQIKNIVEKYSEIFEMAGNIFTVYQIRHLLVKAKKVGLVVKSYMRPSNEEALKDLKISEAYEYLVARKQLKDCLVKNVRGKRGASGRPEVCEEAAHTFAIMVNDVELEEITQIFNKVRNQYIC